jgi:riboflavin kinase/FMN adenylyltransferase
MTVRDPTAADGVAMTIGVFDGVHRGHQDLIGRMVADSRESRFRPVCLTFDPDPDLVLRPNQPQLALSTLADRVRLIHALGVQEVDVVAFTPEVSRLTPSVFTAQLCQKYPVRRLWVGRDFALGRERAGTVDALRGLGERLGFTVVTAPLQEHDGKPISATWIRTELNAGHVELAAALLGRPYCLEGEVVVGMRRGRELGFPTANVVPPPGRALPSDGVYFVETSAVDGAEEGPWLGVVNLGGRPTFDEAERLLETHLLDFAGDLYGSTLRVCFLEQLRGTVRFPSLDALREQIGRDVARARELAGRHRPT